MVFDDNTCVRGPYYSQSSNERWEVRYMRENIGKRDDVRGPISLNVAHSLNEIEERVIDAMTLNCRLLRRIRGFNARGCSATSAEYIQQASIIASDIEHLKSLYEAMPAL